MSICKPRLSRAKEAEHRDYLRKLQAEGVDVEIPEEWQEHLRALDICPASVGNGESVRPLR